MLVFAIAALILLWLLARTFWLLVPTDDGLATRPLQATTAASAAPGVSVSKWHLFGTPLQQQSLQRNAPTTTLNLSLRGTLADADPRSGIAVIADAQGNERAWRVGEEIVAGVILDEVHSDRVVLKHDGVQEILALARDEAAMPACQALVHFIDQGGLAHQLPAHGSSLSSVSRKAVFSTLP